MQVDSCGINLQWKEPQQTQFFSVVGYIVEVKDSEGTFQPYKSCFQTNAMSTSCHMKLNFLVEEPFNLVVGQPLSVRVAAKNSVGNGAFSKPSLLEMNEVIASELQNKFPLRHPPLHPPSCLTNNVTIGTLGGLSWVGLVL